MPKVNIYVRKENLPIWEKIENKSKWFNDRLRDFAFLAEEVKIPPIEIKLDPERVTRFETPRNVCGHGQMKGKCLFPKCAFSRYK